jgi:hypothetical protein
VIVKLQMDANNRIAGVGIAEKNKPEPNAKAQASAAIALDKSFTTNTRANGETSPILTSLNQWLGNYQKVQKVDATTILASSIAVRLQLPLILSRMDRSRIIKWAVLSPSRLRAVKHQPIFKKY